MRGSPHFSTYVLLVVFCMVFMYLLYSSPPEPVTHLSRLAAAKGKKSQSLQTAYGMVSYDEVNERVFQPMGYDMVEETVPIPRLSWVDAQQCDDIFSNWLHIARSDIQGEKPPKELPSQSIDAYTMNGYALLHMWYMNDRSTSAPRIWDQIPKWLTADPHSFANYGKTGMSMYHAMQYHKLEGQEGFVVGSLSPWVEVFALRAGAKKVLTVEYQNTTIVGSDLVSYIHPIAFAEQWTVKEDGFDFAASFSSIEHSGLQRYGDPEDPIGDLREVQKVRCMLKPGGLFFLALPRGQDQLVYNVHRVYGRLRLAMMFSGFELVSVFRDDRPSPFTLKVSDFDGRTSYGGNVQDLFVLRKI